MNDIHGGIDVAELRRFGLHPDDVIDFSANLNPFPLPSAVRRALMQVAVDRYPDRHCGELRQALAERHAVDQQSILVGNGSCELIWLLAHAFLADRKAVILGPAFSEYERAAQAVRAHVWYVDARSHNGFLPPLDAFAAAISQQCPAVAFLANPGNPTGAIIPGEAIVDIANEWPRTIFVVDEAYADCVASPLHTPCRPNIVRLRSLTKAYGLAGLRLGYALGTPAIMAALQAAQPPWSVNACAQAAGVAAIHEEHQVRANVAKWLEAKGRLIEELRLLRFAPLQSATPFFLLPLHDASRTRSLLLRRGILVRDCSSFGLPGHIRICARQAAENARLLAALNQIRAEIEV